MSLEQKKEYISLKTWLGRVILPPNHNYMHLDFAGTSQTVLLLTGLNVCGEKGLL